MSTENYQISEAVRLAGGCAATARAFGVTRQAVFAWKIRGIPANRVRSMVELVAHEVSAKELRPDIFGQPGPS